ncbi:MAG: DUF1501 domain-containing protein [Proteobacteria bacterium]|nr:DUF1501 domain-containing protein [Pseudomonadota bacterium]
MTLFDAGPLGGAANYSNGFLPAAFQPTRLRDRGVPVLDLLPPPEFAPGQRDSLDLIRDLNLQHRDARPAFAEFEARIASYELAYRMQSAALEVGEADREPVGLRRSYGLEHADPRTQAFGRKCLLARRLVERGVRFVQVYDMPDKDGWDAHDQLVKNHEPRARWTDQPVAARRAARKSFMGPSLRSAPHKTSGIAGRAPSELRACRSIGAPPVFRATGPGLPTSQCQRDTTLLKQRARDKNPRKALFPRLS